MAHSDPGLTGLDHIGIVTADLDRSMRAWTERLGVGPWKVSEWDGTSMDVVFRGEPVTFAMRVGFGSIGALHIELAQPLDDRSPFAESLARHGGIDHVYHLRFATADYKSALVAMRDNDVETLMRIRTGSTGALSEATYYETNAELGFQAEIGGKRD